MASDDVVVTCSPSSDPVITSQKTKRGGEREEEEEEHWLLRSYKMHRPTGDRICPPHGPGYIGWHCLLCGTQVPDGPRISLNYIKEGLNFDAHFVHRMRTADLQHVQKTRRLSLVLDLDNTLLHSQPIEHFSNIPFDSHRDREVHVVEAVQTVTRLRPFVRDFLGAVCKMYDLHVYTMGGRTYADEMVRLLDPRGRYFKGKVISHEDSTVQGRKALDVVLGHPSTIVVLDDNVTVWEKQDRHNVIHVKGFFWDPEADDDHILAKVYVLLRGIHIDYFRWEESEFDRGRRDVREIMRSRRREVLLDHHFFFLDRFPPPPFRKKRSWRDVAEEMGATCVDDVEEATHVVCDDVDREDVQWVVKSGKALIGLEWLNTVYYTWECPDS